MEDEKHLVKKKLQTNNYNFNKLLLLLPILKVWKQDMQNKHTLGKIWTL